MKTFKSWMDYLKFESLVLRTSRFVLPEWGVEFLGALLKTSASRKLILPEGTTLWRSQIGSAEPIEIEWEEGESPDLTVRPHPAERMIPRPMMVSEGRVNPKGIPCLYLANDPDTAMAECRPWLDSNISLGEFKTIRDLTLIDCSKDKYRPLFVDDVDDEKLWDEPFIERQIWGRVNRAFSEPVTVSDQTPDYVPTQVIAENFKFNGFDGIKYRSALTDSFNIALFDLNSALLTKCGLCYVKKVEYSFQSTGDEGYETPYGKSLESIGAESEE